MESRVLFLVTDSFVIRGRGTVLVGPPQSVARKMLSAGDAIELRFADGRAIRTSIRGIEPFMGSPPIFDPPVGVLLADDFGKVPEGTTVHPAP
jgi:hypothetical protein